MVKDGKFKVLKTQKYSPLMTNLLALFQNLDLTTYRLIYDGPLTLRLGDTKRFKTIDLHVVLLEDCIMLLQKQDDKYLLIFLTCTVDNTSTCDLASGVTK